MPPFPTTPSPPRLTPSSPGMFPTDTLAQTGEYSIFGLERGGNQAAVRERRVGFTLGLFAVATVIAVAYSIEQYLQSRFIGAPLSLRQLVPAQLVFTYTWVLLAPFVMWTARRYPVWREQR